MDLKVGKQAQNGVSAVALEQVRAHQVVRYVKIDRGAGMKVDCRNLVVAILDLRL